MPVELRSATKISSNAARGSSSASLNESNNNVGKESPSPSHQSNVSQGRMIYVVFFGLVIDLLAFTLILPLLPQLLDHYKNHDGEGGLYHFLNSKVKWFGSFVGAPDQFIPVLFGGLIGSLFSFLQFVASPMIGGLSDYYGRRPLLLISSVGIALSYAIWGSASTFGLFVLARIIGNNLVIS